MARLLQFLALFLCLAVPALTLADTAAQKTAIPTVSIGVPEDVLNDYKVFAYGRKPTDITYYGGPHSRRDVVEVALILQALKLGGLNAHVELKSYPTYMRLQADLRQGIIAMIGSSIWMTDLVKYKGDLRISDAVIKNGEFEAGLYTSPANKQALKATNPADIVKLSAACNKNWTPDWITLKSLGLKELIHIQSWKTMVRNVYHMRSDFLLAPFQQTKDMVLHVDDMQLVPIQGVKVGLSGSRHFAVSKNHPAQNAVFKALRQGLVILQARGDIHKAYRQSGFYNEKVQGWRQIN